MKKIVLAIVIIFSAINISARDIDIFYNYGHKNHSRSHFISYTENTEKLDIIPIYRDYTSDQYTSYLKKYELKLRYKMKPANIVLSGATIPENEGYKGSFYRLGVEKNTQLGQKPLTIWAFLVYRRHTNYKDANNVALANPFKINQTDFKIEFKLNVHGYLADLRFIENLNYSKDITPDTRDPLWLDHISGRDSGFLKRGIALRILSKTYGKFKFRGTIAYLKYRGQRKEQTDLELGGFYTIAPNMTLYYMGKTKSIDGKILDGDNGYRSKFGLRWHF